jgi:hypothetical protein
VKTALSFVALAATSVGAMSAAVSALADPAAAPHARSIDVSRVFDSGAPLGEAQVVLSPTPPDPPPLVERDQWVFDLRWERGDVWLLGTTPRELPAPQATPRAMGRFALELFEGPTLIERVRFDFPLLGPPEPGDAGWTAPPSITPKLRTRIGVVFPATHRGTRLELCDRATNRRWALPWPPGPSSASVPDASPAGSPAR